MLLNLSDLLVKILKFFKLGHYNGDTNTTPVLKLVSKTEKLSGYISFKLHSVSENWAKLEDRDANGSKFWEKSGFPIHETLNGNESTLQCLSVSAIQKLNLIFEI